MLRDILNRAAKDSLVYGIGNGLTRFIQLFMLPIIAKSLSLQEFGDWNLLALTASVLSAFMIFGLDSAIIRFFYDSDDQTYRKRLFSTGLCLMTVVSLFLFGVFWNVSGEVLALLRLSERHEAAYKIAVFWMPGMALQMYLLNWFKWTLQKWKFISITMIFVVCSLVVLVVLDFKSAVSIESILMSSTISQWIAVFFGLFLCRSYFSVNLDFHLLKKVVPYGIPFMLVMLTGALRNSLDRVFLAEYLGNESGAVGLYSMGQRLGMFMSFFVFTLDIAINPLILANWEKPLAADTFAKLQKYYLVIINWASICLCAVAPVLVKLLATDQYLPVIKMFPLFMFGNYILGLYMFAGIGISYSKKSYFNTITLGISLLCLYGLAPLLIPSFHEWGAVFSYCISILVMVALGYIFSHRYYATPFQWSIDILTIFVGLGISMVLVNISLAENYLLNVLLSLAIGNMAYFVYAWVITTPNEKQFVRNQIQTAMAFVKSKLS